MAWILYDVAIELAGLASKASDELKLRDADLARQLRRAASSIPLNLAEGAGRIGKDRLHHYRIAFASAKEVMAAFEVATVMGYGDFRTEAALAERCCRLAFGAAK